MKATLILVIVSLVLSACSTGGMVHVHYVPSPTPHKVVMIRWSGPISHIHRSDLRASPS